jgi:hypothetical protein
MKKILICDDDSKVRLRWKNALDAIPSVKRQFDVQTVGGADFKVALSDLESRRRKARNRKLKASAWGDNAFDSAAILIVDYDLLDFNKEDYLTGEGVAYLARCYSRCGLIIALNQFGKNTFDLTLRGNPKSFADLNLSSRQLANRSLWQEPWKGFRPSYWPMLPIALKAFESRVNGLKGNLSKTILSYLGFPDETCETLPRSTKEFLGSGDKPEVFTFRDFVKESGQGLRGIKDEALDDESVARIAAARISKWLERMVLSGQDVLVDAPHLASRFPSRLSGNVGTISAWNKTAFFGGLKALGLKHSRIAKFQFGKQEWLSRPAWFWKPLSNFDGIPEVADPWSTERPDFVFCEDLSRFLPSAAAQEFVADLPSPFVRRFVLDKGSSKGRPFAHHVRGVEYVPGLRFSL